MYRLNTRAGVLPRSASSHFTLEWQLELEPDSEHFLATLVALHFTPVSKWVSK